MERLHCTHESMWRRVTGFSLLACFTILMGVPLCVGQNAPSKDAAGLPAGSWRFVVSGDSRNCGDIVMPALATHSARFAPSFYWHLGDLRAIYKIDEDMFFAAQKSGQALSCENYLRRTWDDFVENQISAFGDVPFYVGIGNHEVIPPKNGDAFRRQFFDWLSLPALQRQRQLDGEPALPQPYYHWTQGGVDLIYLDNSYDFFYDEEITWLIRRLQGAKLNSEVKSLVVGMHEALPDSLANAHSMGDNPNEPRARSTGETVYKLLLGFRESSHKPVYVLASHSHFFMKDIFNTPKLTENGAKPLSGWIVGTGGAVRYKLPEPHPPTAQTDVYGYLLGTVSANGTIDFSFEEVRESDVPQSVQQRYPPTSLPWCFEHNSQNKDPKAPDLTPHCAP
jgi:hypothetical protein